MAAAFEKALAWSIENSPPPVVVLILICIFSGLLLWLSYRINKVIGRALSQEQQQTDKITEHDKQMHKFEQLVAACPCVSKNNAMWLQDRGRNGGQPPEPTICAYLRDKK